MYNKFTSRIAAAVLAGALAIGGLMGAGAVVVEDQQAEVTVEETAATWSFVGQPGRVGPIGKGGVTSARATWS